MRKNFLDRLGHEWLFCDGGTGTLLQSMGLQAGELPETWNKLHPDRIQRLYESYLRAGADIFNTNTFGANRLKYPDGTDLEEYVTDAVKIAIQARKAVGREDDAFIALDLGPTGKLLEPMGDLSFDRAVELFGEVVRIGVAAGRTCTAEAASGKSVKTTGSAPAGDPGANGVDLILIETMTDSYEAKAAVLAAKENCDLPVCITTTYDGTGKLLTGGSVDSVVALLEGLGVDALGINCSLGPREMLPVVKHLTEVASIPIIVNPNAGLPHTENGRTVYDVGPDDFAETMGEIADLGVQVVGGCCGTTPEYIQKVIQTVRPKPFCPNPPKHRSIVTSFSQSVEIGKKPVIIGERINPTGKKKFREALIRGDLDYIAARALEEEEAGADILDVNVGIPDIDEADMMEKVVKKLQEVTDLPLQIDTTNPKALERALRIYNGKAMVNSVNGKKEQIETVMPIVRKYGGVLVGLCIDEGGIPQTADGRIGIARKIYKAAENYGIRPEDIVIDGLAMTISSEPESANTTLETIRRVRDELHGHSILGVSNISFGLPQRPLINAFFLAMAMQSGLSCAIVNPNSEGMMAAYHAFLALTNQDPQCMQFIDKYAEREPVVLGDKKKITGAGSKTVLQDTGAGMPGTEIGAQYAGAAAGGTASAGARAVPAAPASAAPVVVVAIPSGQAVMITAGNNGQVIVQGASADNMPAPIGTTALVTTSTPGTAADYATLSPGSASGNAVATSGTSTGNTAGSSGTVEGSAAVSAKSAAGGAAAAAKASADRNDPDSLFYCIRKGLKGPAADKTRKQLSDGRPAMDIIDGELIPALDVVGKGFEKGTIFLPQLLMAAEASQAAFAVIRESMAGKPQKIKGRIILATVKGDIHDIGKNIVKVMLENYGYDVIDLGKDVPPETIVDTAIKENIRLVGLSALMTTTVPSMEETIRQLRQKKPDCKVIVGGAVMTQEYADKIGADAYGKDAMSTVRYADTLFAG